ncbi:1-deoxy-D-xylulose 5-phosphate reductoisomerase [Aggregatibacter aphrophilus NJ8700]|nr:1-deoxy-D-xylulose 5-phosphate reductoisomerase [Aggregatibacter aphrophilus NJ8700]
MFILHKILTALSPTKHKNTHQTEGRLHKKRRSKTLRPH